MKEKKVYKGYEESSQILRKNALLRSGATNDKPKWSAIKAVTKFGQLQPTALYNPMSERFQERYKSWFMAMMSDDFASLAETIRTHKSILDYCIFPDDQKISKESVREFLNKEIAYTLDDKPSGIITKRFAHQNSRLIRPTALDRSRGFHHEALFSMLYAIRDKAIPETDIDVFERMLMDYIHWIYSGYTVKDSLSDNTNKKAVIVYNKSEERIALFYELVLLLCTGNLEAVRTYRRRRLSYDYSRSLDAFCYYYARAVKHWENPLLKAWLDSGPNIRDSANDGNWVYSMDAQKAYPAICFTAYALNSTITDWLVKSAICVWAE